MSHQSFSSLQQAAEAYPNATFRTLYSANEFHTLQTERVLQGRATLEQQAEVLEANYIAAGRTRKQLDQFLSDAEARTVEERIAALAPKKDEPAAPKVAAPTASVPATPAPSVPASHIHSAARTVALTPPAKPKALDRDEFLALDDDGQVAHIVAGGMIAGANPRDRFQTVAEQRAAGKELHGLALASAAARDKSMHRTAKELTGMMRIDRLRFCEQSGRIIPGTKERP